MLFRSPCIEAHRLASESDSHIEPLLKRPRTCAPTTHTPQINHLQHPTTGDTAPTPPPGMDVDQHDADLDEPATPFASDQQDTQLEADDSTALDECQGQAETQQARPTPRKKPGNWGSMSKTQRNSWRKNTNKGGKGKRPLWH